MTTAVEVFVVQLARASKHAGRYLRNRNLSPEDRADILAAAMLWCWENRTSYSLTTTIETWFTNAIRDAYKAWRRGESRQAAEIIEDIGVPDDTSARAQSLQIMEKITTRVAAMPELEQKIAALLMREWTHEEIRAELKVDSNMIPVVRRKLMPFSKQLSDTADTRWLVRKTLSRDSDEASDALAPIDKEIEALEFAPPAGKECPPCWRCKWFEGYMPGAHLPVRMPITEPMVAEAVSNTEAEKIRIAQGVRDGNI